MAGNKAQAEAEAAASKWTLEQLAHYLTAQVGRGGQPWTKSSRRDKPCT